MVLVRVVGGVGCGFGGVMLWWLERVMVGGGW